MYLSWYDKITHTAAVHSVKETLFLECMDYQHVTKDRSLGYVELHVNDLAEEADSEEYPYKSTGRKVEAANLRFEKGVFKGQLHYEAEFVPALALKDFKFSAGGNNIQQTANGDAANGEGSSVSTSDVDGEAVPVGITTRGPLGAKRKENTVNNETSADTGNTDDEHELGPTSPTESRSESEGKGNAEKGVVRSKEELMGSRKSASSLRHSSTSHRGFRIRNHSLQHHHCPTHEEGPPRSSARRCVLASVHYLYGPQSQRNLGLYG
jgi:hypothetical protein